MGTQYTSSDTLRYSRNIEDISQLCDEWLPYLRLIKSSNQLNSLLTIYSNLHILFSEEKVLFVTFGVVSII